MGRLDDKIAIIVGAGQTPGEGLGNGRATAITFAREGATILAVDRNLASAQETADIINGDGGHCAAFQADITNEADIVKAVRAAEDAWGRIDIVDNNVGVSIGAGDAPLDSISAEAFDAIYGINLRGPLFFCRHVLPIMRKQGSGSIVNISSIAAFADYPTVAYKATKAALVALTRQMALDNAQYGIRVNAVLPGLIDTPMAIQPRVNITGRSRADIAAERDAQVPLLGHMGTAWDVANAVLFLASDEAKFITGIGLVVDGGAMTRVG